MPRHALHLALLGLQRLHVALLQHRAELAAKLGQEGRERHGERDHKVELLGQGGAHDATAHRFAKQHKRKLATGGQHQAAAGGERVGGWGGV